MVNLVIGNFLNLLSDFSVADPNNIPDNFMSAVSTTA
jgi:ATP-binding cassette subfamily B (MDR/TAP) protein 1